MSSLSGNSYGTAHQSIHQSIRHSRNWDEDTLGAPGDDPEVVGTGDPERVLELVPGKGFRKSTQSEKIQNTKTTELSEYQHQHSESESSTSSRH